MWLAISVPQEPGEIGFKCGDIVHVWRDVPAPAGWWYGEHGGSYGIVPMTFFIKNYRTLLR